MAADGLRLVLGHLLGNAASHGATAVCIRSNPDGFEVADIALAPGGPGARFVVTF